MSKRFTLFCGIDVGKRRHAFAALDRDGEIVLPPRYFPNTREGFEGAVALLCELGRRGSTRIGMEATGHYWHALYEYLARRGYDVAVLNPIQTARQARREVRRRKTDKLDAKRVARLLREGGCRSAVVPGELAMTCRQATRLWYTLGAQRTRIKQLINAKLESAWPEYEEFLSDPLGPTGQAILTAAPTPADLLAMKAPALEQLIGTASHGRLGGDLADRLRASAGNSIGMTRGIEGTRLAIRTLLEQLRATAPVRENLREAIAALAVKIPSCVRSLPGASDVTAVSLFGETDPIKTFTKPEALMAFAGLDPSVFQTGEYLAPHRSISKRGSPYLRHTLWTMARNATMREGDLQRYYLRRRAAGLHHLAAVTATALRLCHVVWRILTDGRDYRPEGRPTPSLATSPTSPQ